MNTDGGQVRGAASGTVMPSCKYRPDGTLIAHRPPRRGHRDRQRPVVLGPDSDAGRRPSARSQGGRDASARLGAVRVLLVTGKGGVGKTTVAAATAAHAAARGGK